VYVSGLSLLVTSCHFLSGLVISSLVLSDPILSCTAIPLPYHCRVMSCSSSSMVPVHETTEGGIGNGNSTATGPPVEQVRQSSPNPQATPRLHAKVPSEISKTSRRGRRAGASTSRDVFLHRLPWLPERGSQEEGQKGLSARAWVRCRVGTFAGFQGHAPWLAVLAVLTLLRFRVAVGPNEGVDQSAWRNDGPW
jgi:hypothetical protein